MDFYVLSIIAKSAGITLSEQAVIMERALYGQLQDIDVVLCLEFGTIEAVESTERQPVFLESDIDSIELFTRNGAEREPLLIFSKNGVEFDLTGGQLFDEMISTDL